MVIVVPVLRLYSQKIQVYIWPPVIARDTLRLWVATTSGASSGSGCAMWPGAGSGFVKGAAAGFVQVATAGFVKGASSGSTSGSGSSCCSR